MCLVCLCVKSVCVIRVTGFLRHSFSPSSRLPLASHFTSDDATRQLCLRKERENCGGEEKRREEKEIIREKMLEYGVKCRCRFAVVFRLRCCVDETSSHSLLANNNRTQVQHTHNRANGGEKRGEKGEKKNEMTRKGTGMTMTRMMKRL